MKLAALVAGAMALMAPAAAARAAGHEAIPAFEGTHGAQLVTATAYTSGPESTGKRPGHPAYGITASGEPTREGETLAVDPSHIPLGSLVYIEELDKYLVAQDTGGAIRGARIDLYMENLRDALEWGVRPVHIQVFPRI